MKCRILGGFFLVLGMLCAAPNVRADAPAPGQVIWSYASGYTNLADFAVSKDGRVYLGYSEMMPGVTQLESGATVVTVLSTNQLIAVNHLGDLNWQVPAAGQYLAVTSQGRVASSLANIKRTLVTLPSGSAFAQQIVSNKFYIYGQGGDLVHEASSGGRLALTADNSFIVANIQRQPNFVQPSDFARIDGAAYTNVWQQHTDRLMGEAPVIATDGSIYLTAWGPGEAVTYPNGYVSLSPTPPPSLHAYDANGNSKWFIYQEDTGYLPPAISADGTLITASHRAITNRAPEDWTVTSVDHEYKLNAISPDGTIKWSVQKPEEFSLAAIGETNNIYVCHGNKLLALTPTGAERWSYDATEPLKLSPALAANDTVYVATEPGKLLAINSETGTKNWEYQAGRPIYHAPVIGTNGNVYLLVDRADIVVLAGSGEVANTPWPMERHDAQRTSRAVQASAREVGRNEEGKVSLMLNVEPGRAYKVEASEDLETWEEIGSFTSSNAAQTFLDETSAGKPQRFYRLVVP